MRKNLIAGFTLIELLVVVAILGVLSAVGVIAFGTYTTSTKMSAASNTMQQISLAQTEFFSDSDEYFNNGSNSTCTPTQTTSDAIADSADGLGIPIAYQDISFYFCIYGDSSSYTIKAVADYGAKDCEITLSSKDNKVVRNDKC